MSFLIFLLGQRKKKKGKKKERKKKERKKKDRLFGHA
jgi:hypothetical protein